MIKRIIFAPSTVESHYGMELKFAPEISVIFVENALQFVDVTMTDEEIEMYIGGRLDINCHDISPFSARQEYDRLCAQFNLYHYPVSCRRIDSFTLTAQQ